MFVEIAVALAALLGAPAASPVDDGSATRSAPSGPTASTATGTGQGATAVVVHLRRHAIGSRLPIGRIGQTGRARPGTERAIERTGRRLRRLARDIEALGARISSLEPVNATVLAEVSRPVAEKIARLPQVARLEPAARAAPRSTPTLLRAVGVPDVWAAGFTGGSGSADCPGNHLSDAPRGECADPRWSRPDSGPDLAIWADPIQKDHPALAGVRFQTVAGAPDSTDPVTERHGTAVASIIISQGVTQCPTAAGYVCNPSDLSGDRRGVAYGIDSVLDTHAMSNQQALERYSPAAWMVGFDQIGYETGATIRGADDPAEVLSYSGGATPFDATTGAYVDYSASDGIFDALVDSHGVSVFEAGGNAGTTLPVAGCRAYNAVCVGATDHRGTTSPADDQVAAYSQRGPTAAGRKKPDLVAPGNAAFVANRNWQSSGQLWRSVEGTSFSTPAAAGAGVLLNAAGLTDARRIKALLVNSARPGRAAPNLPVGTQTGWQPDWGWGMLDLATAFAQRAHTDLAEVSADEPAFYLAAAEVPGNRVTATWNRHPNGCAPDLSACAETADRPVADIDLHAHDLDPSSCESRAAVASTSAIDNVEQVRAQRAGSVLYRLTALADDDRVEVAALAAASPLRRLESPQPALAVDVDAVPSVGETATVTITARNTSAEMALCGAHIDAPLLSANLELVAELDSRYPASSLAPLGATSRTWLVRALAPGNATITATASGSAYGSILRDREDTQLTIPGETEAAAGDPVQPAGPTGERPEPPLDEPLAAGRDPRPQSGPYSPLGVPLTAPVAVPAKRSPQLRLLRVARRGPRRRLIVRGASAATLSGRIGVSVRWSRRRGFSTRHATAPVRNGVFATRFALPRRPVRIIHVSAMYGGDEFHAPERVTAPPRWLGRS